MLKLRLDIHAFTLLVTPLLLLTSTLSAGESLQKPTVLKANGKLIDTESLAGYCGPTMEDIDLDGDLDLIVGTYGYMNEAEHRYDGKFHVYTNVGTDQNPVYNSSVFLQADGEDAHVWISCCVAASPTFADVNGDGLRDLISGSYVPGAVYWFPRTTDPKNPFGKRQEFFDTNGNSLRLHSDNTPLYKSYGSFPAVVDWDDDGDFDLIIGYLDGSIVYRQNVGDEKHAIFSEDIVSVLADGFAIKLLNGGHAAVTTADWDNDGLWDLLSGCNDGSVVWFRNVGRKGAPKFSQAQTLIESVPYTESRPYIVADGPTRGKCSQIHVVDYNRDGMLDILVGDHQMCVEINKPLTQEDRDIIEDITNRRMQRDAIFKMELDQMRNEVAMLFPGEIESEEAIAELSQRMQKWYAGPKGISYLAEYSNLNDELVPYVDEKEVFDGRFSPKWNGFVWLYLRSTK